MSERGRRGLLGLALAAGVLAGAASGAASAGALRPPRLQRVDLHGLAQLSLPERWRFIGLDTRHRDLPPAAQLERHDGRGGLVFEFEAEARNDWGGHPLDPLRLNLVLLDPRHPGAAPERGFSIGRYYPPTGQTIPLTDARWQSSRDAQGRTLRVLAMNDPFGSAAEPRWAMSLWDPARAVRADLFVWRSRLARDEAEALLAMTLDSLVLAPARDAFFRRAEQAPQHQDTMRRQQVARFFAALAPLGVAAAAPGAITLGPDTAAWQDADGRALRMLRVLARIELDATVPRSASGRPRLARPAPGPSSPALPAWTPELLYWHADSGQWRKTGLPEQRGPDDWPLLPIEAAVAARLPDRGAHLIASFHAYQPPVLDDVDGLPEFLSEAGRWRAALLIPPWRGTATAVRLLEAPR